jgi:hypothetical protein
MATVRTNTLGIAMAATVVAACSAKGPKAGAFGESAAHQPRITAVDSSYPPQNVSVQLDRPSYAALLLVAPGHSATLLYPQDSMASNELGAGTHVLPVKLPEGLIISDSLRAQLIARARDTTRSQRPRGARTRTIMPLSPLTPTYLLVITSPQQLSYRRILEKTQGVTIPLDDVEALNAVGKAIKSTLAAEPREWSAYYQQVSLRRPT